MFRHSFRHLVPATITAFLAVTLVASPALAAPGDAVPAARQGHDQTAPTVMREAAAAMRVAPVGHLEPLVPPPGASRPAGAATATPASSSLRREVFGFADAGSLADPTRGYPGWDLSLLSTVAYFGLTVAWNGTFIDDSGKAVWNSSQLSTLRDRLHAAGGRLVLTIILQDTPGDPDGGAAMCGGLINAQTTADLAADEVAGKGADGVNIDYEGATQTCGNGVSNRALLIGLAQRLRAEPALAGRYLSIDTYASSAGDGGGFFDVRGLSPYVDSFFVMEYALEYSNWQHLGCIRFCVTPTSPVDGYYYNDRRSNSEYAAAVGAGKVIMGVPYYGDKACVDAPNPNALSTGHYATSDYLYNKSLPGQPGVTEYAAHRDAVSGHLERWDTYRFADYNCWRELYWDDAASLGAKYDLVNQQSLRGVGIWNLNQGGGTADSPELWDALHTHFTLIPGAPSEITATAGDTFANVGWSAPAAASPITRYTVTASPGGASLIFSGSATAVAFGGLSNGQSYTFTIRAGSAYGDGPVSAPSNAVTPAPPPGSWPGRHHATGPARLLDTRLGGSALPTLQGGKAYPLAVLGRQGIPATGVAAVLLNITATNPSRASYVSVTPTGSSPTAVSTVNFGPGGTAANLAETGLGADGRVQLYNSAGTADVIVDVVGWVGVAADTGFEGHYRPLPPSRSLDTRLASQGFGRVGPARTVSVAIGGGVPAGASAAVVNLTAVSPDHSSFLRIWPSGAAPPPTSNLNFAAGQTIANRAVVEIGPDGRIQLYNSEGTTDVLVDVVGYLSGAVDTPGLYTSTTPIRALDTRSAIGGPQARLGGGGSISVQISGQPGLPSGGIAAVVVNLTVTNPTANSYLAVSDSGAAGGTSDLNFGPGQTVANLVLARVNQADGSIRIYNSAGDTDVLVDINGWYGN